MMCDAPTMAPFSPENGKAKRGVLLFPVHLVHNADITDPSSLPLIDEAVNVATSPISVDYPLGS